MANLTAEEVRRRECYPELLQLAGRVAEAARAIVAKRNAGTTPEDLARRTLWPPCNGQAVILSR